MRSNDLRQNGEDRDDELQYESSSSISDAESCSSDCEDEAISRQNQPSGLVYDFSSLMAQLPNPSKRGLSKYYDGKSQSFTSLSDAKCIEDLPKKENPYNKRKMIKSCKSYADGLFNKDQNGFCNHDPNNKDISKQPSRGSCGNLMARNNGRNFLCRPPAIP